jgi:hypothetical protein
MDAKLRQHRSKSAFRNLFGARWPKRRAAVAEPDQAVAALAASGIEVETGTPTLGQLAEPTQ